MLEQIISPEIQPINSEEEETRYNRIRFCGESLGVKPRPSLSWHFWQYQSVRKCDGVFFYLLILYTAKWCLCFHFSFDTNFWQIAKEKSCTMLAKQKGKTFPEQLFDSDKTLPLDTVFVLIASIWLFNVSTFSNWIILVSYHKKRSLFSSNLFCLFSNLSPIENDIIYPIEREETKQTFE